MGLWAHRFRQKCQWDWIRPVLFSVLQASRLCRIARMVCSLFFSLKPRVGVEQSAQC